MKLRKLGQKRKEKSKKVRNEAPDKTVSNSSRLVRKSRVIALVTCGGNSLGASLDLEESEGS